MSHHYKTQHDGYSTLTMVGVGYTMRVSYPEVRVLSFANLEKLIALLGRNKDDFLSSLCNDLLQTASYLVHDGGVVEKKKISLEPVKLQGAMQAHEVKSPYVQGIRQLEETLASWRGAKVRQISVVSSHVLFIVHVDEAIEEVLGVVRVSMRTLNDLAAECTAKQGFVTFAN